LDATNVNAIIVRTTDGTQLKFEPVSINNEYRCTQIKDRNGNYISATYNTTNGHLQTITDTLGRVITFDYDTSSNLQTIKQTWAGVTHNWATFYYGQVYVAPAFGGSLLVNGPNNNYTTVLTQVNLNDGTYFTFNYNSAFAQVNRINQYAADAHLLNYTSYNVSSSSGQTECPRFTERRQWAENWNNGNEAVTTYSVATDNSWSQQTSPDGTIYKEFFATSGWQSGLNTGSEVWSGGVKKKWTTVSWTQDDTSLLFQKNPRVTETNVYDQTGNRRRVTISYYPASSFNLPSDVYEYAANGTTVLRQTHTNYNLNSAYIDRRIIGLPSGKYVFDGSGTLYKFDVFDYDYGGGAFVATPQPAVQHDSAYGISFLTGRGNLSLVRRANVNNTAQWQDTVYTYNTTGSVTAITDPLWRTSTISYTDSFSDAVNRNTFAYPTTITDPDNFSTTVQYNYDFSGVTRTQDPKGTVQTRTYDSFGRTDRITNQTSTAYVRYVYGAPGYIQTYSTIQNGAGEAYGITYFDGAGRVRAAGADHPGSTGGYSGRLIFYDVMGRMSQQTNPAEMNGSWVPAGDDAAGWASTYQTYDWNSRPLLTTNPDGTTRENTYGGCGCAGGDQITVRDERGRRKRYTNDVVGRLVKVEELNWDQTVYATTNYTLNVRDQLTTINQAGQTRTMAYDGYGRAQSRTTPEQGTMTYSYFSDDRIQTVTDARGATTTFAYNNRGLVTGITYGVPSGVAATPNVTFGYDAIGNRTSMTDGLGSVSYVYNTLSQMTSETRTFTGVGAFTLSYGYNLSGQLNSITNHWGAQVGYGYDKTGRVTSVSGAGYGGVSSYVNSMAYRAFGMKQTAYNNGRTLSVQYDNRMRPTQWNIPSVMGWNYGYTYFGENTGRVTYAQNLNDATLDRSFHYDHVGRLQSSFSGSAARAHVGTGSSWASDGPYAAHDNVYDVWGNTTSRTGWGGTNAQYSAAFTNNKMNTMTYDASGNLANAGGGWTFTYDATGQQTYSTVGNLQQYYDGDRLRGKKSENGVVTYYQRSTVLGGQVVAEITGSGTWQRGYVYLGGAVLAVQQGGVYWMHQDPIVKSKRVTDGSGAIVSTVELDPWGGETSRSSNEAFQPRKFTTYIRDSIASDDAMHRRYNRWWGRFEQPDPYEGSYNLADPQSFNRYSYTQNDPVNFTDPTGLCAFSVAVDNRANLTDGQMQAVRDRMTAVFEAAGQQISFLPANAPNATFNLTIWENPAASGRTEGSTTVGSVQQTGGRVANNGFVYVERLQNSAMSTTIGKIIFPLSERFLGLGLGTAAGHEMGHYLLQTITHDPNDMGLMRASFGGHLWFAPLHTFTIGQILKLGNLCKTITTNSDIPNNFLNFRGTGGRVGLGGISPLYYGEGWGGGWGQSMWDFLNWVNSIGRDPEVIVTACVGSDCPPE
jgi:RHS repeat-associated protein